MNPIFRLLARAVGMRRHEPTVLAAREWRARVIELAPYPGLDLASHPPPTPDIVVRVERD